MVASARKAFRLRGESGRVFDVLALNDSLAYQAAAKIDAKRQAGLVPSPSATIPMFVKEPSEEGDVPEVVRVRK